MRLHFHSRTVLLAWTVLAVVFGPTATAQPTSSVDTFDLVLVGDSLTASAHDIALKSNPVEGEQWETRDALQCDDPGRLLLLTDLPASRYLGQDIRENHLSLRVTSETSGASLRAAYAVPSTSDGEDTTCARLAELVETRPQTVRHHSLAVYERPRPAQLSPSTPFINHVEAPIRHRKPGVMEVEWLEIIFRNE